MKFAFQCFTLSTLWLAASNSFAQAQTIAETVVADDNFSTLETVVLAVDGAADFLQNNEATVFAPPNSAFAAVDADFLAKLLTKPFSLHLQNLLFYHVIQNMVILAADIVDGSKVTALSGETLEFSTTGGVIINGLSTVTTADLELDNGVVHVVDQVLLPSWVSSTVYGVASSVDAFSTLVALIDAAMLADTLNGDGPFTVFAPTNAAFTAALAANPDLDVTDIELVSSILLTHVVGGAVAAEDITNGKKVTAVSGERLKFRVRNGSVTVNDVPIISTNVLANNGIIHVLGGVILPEMTSSKSSKSSKSSGSKSSKSKSSKKGKSVKSSKRKRV